MKVYLDFDGTVVEHKYPAIGKYNEGAFDVIKKLLDAGHEVILNTYRVELSGAKMLDAKDYILRGLGIESMPHTIIKFHPSDWDWQIFNANDVIYIDDCGTGHPMRKDAPMIDWAVVDLEFKANGVY